MGSAIIHRARSAVDHTVRVRAAKMERTLWRMAEELDACERIIGLVLGVIQSSVG
jgi:hypothetical protein